MCGRCNNPKNDAYVWYGGRGISVCVEWEDYLTFRDWALKNGYSDELSIDRIDVNGDYCPQNCKWSTFIDQCNNRRSNRFLEFNGETLSISQWGRKLGIRPQTINSRLRMGWSVEKALTTEVAHKNK